MSRAWLAVLLALLLASGSLAPACSIGAPAQTPEQRDAGSLRQHFSSSSAATATNVLARGGISVYDDEGGAVLRQALSPGAMSVTQAQSRNLALELADRAGYPGWDLDELVDAGPDNIPPSYLLAGYAATGDTYGARLSNALLAGQNLQRPADVVFPTMSLLLFVSDVAEAWAKAPPSQSQGAEVELLAAHPAITDPCGSVSTFFGNALNALADKIAAAVTPGDVPILKSIIGFAIKTLIQQGITIAGKIINSLPFIQLLQKVLGIIGIMGSIASSLRGWSISLTAAPSAAIHYAVGSATVNGRITATVDDQGGDLFSTPIRSCAQLVGVDLPHAGAPGSKVEWLVRQGIPVDASVLGTPDSVISKSNSASFNFTMSKETENAHLHGEEHNDHQIEVAITVRRADTSEVSRVINQLLTGGLGSAIRPFIAATVNGILDKLARLVDPSSVATVVVTYHTEPSPSPGKTPTPTPSPTPSPRPLPNACDLLTVADVDNVLGASPKQQLIAPTEPGSGTSCLYGPTTIDWKIPWALAGLAVMPASGWPAIIKGKTPISGVGDEAYIDDGPKDQSGILVVRSGSTYLMLTISLGAAGARQVLTQLAQIAISHL